MMYIIFVLIALASVAAICAFAARMGAVDFGDKLPLYKPAKADNEVSPYRGTFLTLLIMICVAALTAMQILLYKNTSTINFVKLYGTGIIIFAAAIVDSKRRIIPNILIIAGLVFRLLLYFWETFSDAEMSVILRNDLIGLVLGFGLLGIVSLVSKGALGFGDAKLFGVIGITCGTYCTYSTLLISLIFSVIVSVVGMLRKKMTRKDAFPFGPCIAVGYILTILLNSY